MLPKQGKKLPGAPAEQEVEAMLSDASAWLRVTIALAVFTGLGWAR